MSYISNVRLSGRGLRSPIPFDNTDYFGSDLDVFFTFIVVDDFLFAGCDFVFHVTGGIDVCVLGPRNVSFFNYSFGCPSPFGFGKDLYSDDITVDRTVDVFSSHDEKGTSFGCGIRDCCF
jgi:hypothetical protein